MWLSWSHGEGSGRAQCGAWGLWLRIKTRIFNLASRAQPSLPLIRGSPHFTPALLFYVYSINIHRSPHLPLHPEDCKGMACEYFSSPFYPWHSAWYTEHIQPYCWMNEYCRWVHYFHWGRFGEAGVYRLSCSYYEDAERTLYWFLLREQTLSISWFNPKSLLTATLDPVTSGFITNWIFLQCFGKDASNSKQRRHRRASTID